MEYISLCSCYLVLFFFQLFQWLPTAYRIKLKTHSMGYMAPPSLSALVHPIPPWTSRSLLSHTFITLWTLNLSPEDFFSSLTHKPHVCKQTLNFSAKLRHPSFSAPSPLAFLLCPMTCPYADLYYSPVPLTWNVYASLFP